MRSAVSTSIGCISFAFLSACSGGGGGETLPTVAFSGFSNLPANGTTNFTGVARDGDFSQSAGQPNRISTVGFTRSGAATASVVTRNGEIVAITVSGPGSNTSVDTRGNGTEDDLIFSTPDGQVIWIIDPDAAGFEHQTFGLWTERTGLSGKLGVGSFGNQTPAGSVPVASATYSGGSVGFAVGNTSTWYVTASNVSVSTNFSTIAISSSGTQIVEAGTNTVVPSPALDFSGTGSVTGTEFTAAVSGSSGLSGDANGRFYGPGAEEVGGTFNLNGTSFSHYAGSFGGTR